MEEGRRFNAKKLLETMQLSHKTAMFAENVGHVHVSMYEPEAEDFGSGQAWTLDKWDSNDNNIKRKCVKSLSYSENEKQHI